MLKYTVIRLIDDRHIVTGSIVARNNRHVIERVKPACGVRPKAKLRRDKFFAAGFIEILLGRVRIFPIKKKREYAERHGHRPHPRKLTRPLLAA